jgi:hypothetical protein
MSCPINSTDFLIPGNNATYGDFTDSAIKLTKCGLTYIRPAPAGAMIPWIYALAAFLFHMPACVIRIVRWESAQYLALVLAVIDITICIQSYVSTGRRPAEVLVWMPLTIVLDFSAMLQLVVLIYEEHEELLLLELSNAAKGFVTLVASRYRRLTNNTGPLTTEEDETPVEVEGGQLRDARDNIEMAQRTLNGVPSGPPSVTTRKERRRRLRHAGVGVLALIFLLWIFFLQVFGLTAAVHGRRNHEQLFVKWCSPTFRDFAIAVRTGNCKVYPIVSGEDNGIDCISIPGEQQKLWLLLTIVGLSLAFFCQFVDILFMLSDKKKRCAGVKLKRPWTTMFFGTAVLFILIIVGILNAEQLPTGITDVIWLYRRDSDTSPGRVCQGTLSPPGLRGNIIAWTDGVFDNWNATYYGAPTH